MTFSWDFNTATLSLIALQIVGFIVYSVKTNGKANEAYKLATLALKKCEELAASINILTASLSLEREKRVTDHPSQDDLREMEKRLTTEIHRVTDRIDDLIKENRRQP